MDTSIVPQKESVSQAVSKWNRFIECRICHNVFERNHWNQFICGETCKAIAIHQAKTEYKKTDKGKESKAKWIRSDKRKINEKRYSQKTTYKKARLEAQKRYQLSHPKDKSKASEIDKKYVKTERGQQARRKARERYQKTEKYKTIVKASKARRRTAVGSYSRDEWRELLGQYNNCCAYCGSKERIHADHIVSVSRGGSSFIANIQPLCIHCNLSKRHKIYIPMAPLAESGYVIVG